MKKLFCLALCALTLFSAISCSKPKVFSPNVPPKLSNEEQSSREQIVRYRTFEEMVAASTDVIKGKYVGMRNTDNNSVEYEFAVMERFLGEPSEGNIFVFSPGDTVSVLGKSVSYKPTDLRYEEGQEYYLVLSRRRNVYLHPDYDRYLNIGGNLFMPANDIKNSTVYGESLTKHSELGSISSESKVVDHMLGIVNDMIENGKTNPIGGTPFIADTNPDVIIDGSSFILKVKIKEGVSIPSQVTDLFKCTVLTSLKGSVESGETVEIYFMKGTVSVGEEYILALEEMEGIISPRTFAFSSTNSVFEVSEQENIEQRLNT